MLIEEPPYYTSDVEDYIDIPEKADCHEIQELRYSCKRKCVEIEALDDQLFKFIQVIQDLNYKKFLYISYFFDLKQRIKRVEHNTSLISFYFLLK